MPKTKNIPLPDSRVGILFPSWMAKFIEEFNKEGKKKSNTKFQPLTHQYFLQAFFRNESPIQSLFLYHGLGTGKTCSVLFTYNSLFNFDKNWNVYILIPKALQKTWEDAILTCLNTENNSSKNIHFIIYNGYTVAEKFDEMLKKNQRTGVRDLFVIDEAHNLISNVVNNIHHPKEKSRTPALRVYRKIQDILMNDKSSRLLLISATPAINEAYELAILFNLLKPKSLFPEDYNQFNDIFVNPKTGGIKEIAKNLFQRRILDCISFVMPSNPDDFALQVNIPIIRLRMSEYQENIYKKYRKSEQLMRKISGDTKYGEGTFNIYTRQACNFVFPDMNKDFNAFTRRIFGIKNHENVLRRLSDDQKRKVYDLEMVMKYDGQKKRMKGSDRISLILGEKVIDEFINQVRNYWNKLDEGDNRTIHDDIVELFQMHSEGQESHTTVEMFIQNKKESHRSKRYESMIDCSRKMVFIILTILLSPGISIVYSSFVRGEGLQIFQLYLESFNILEGSLSSTNEKNPKHKPKYLKFTGELNPKQRSKAQDIVNDPKNKYGEYIKIILISQAGAEGISIMCCRQVHLIEPYYHETRSQQLIGRGIRQGSHKRLDKKDRTVSVYRYLSVIADSSQTIDEIIYDKSKKKQSGIEEFFTLMRQVAIDCSLFSELNIKHPSIVPYRCFDFTDENILRSDLGFAYRKQLEKDMLLENKGYDSINTIVKNINVKKVKGIFVHKDKKESNTDIINCLLDTKSGYVYHDVTKKVIGTAKRDHFGFFEMYSPSVWKIYDPVSIYV